MLMVVPGGGGLLADVEDGGLGEDDVGNLCEHRATTGIEQGFTITFLIFTFLSTSS